ncbi:hypothetical protein BS17DRAFT_769679 [Gyrodon lividus]|nr:hypothetical protein BS17DRAFT_769679 [Gyrodon lividus]
MEAGPSSHTLNDTRWTCNCMKYGYRKSHQVSKSAWYRHLKQATTQEEKQGIRAANFRVLALPEQVLQVPVNAGASSKHCKHAKPATSQVNNSELTISAAHEATQNVPQSPPHSPPCTVLSFTFTDMFSNATTYTNTTTLSPPSPSPPLSPPVANDIEFKCRRPLDINIDELIDSAVLS